MSSKTYRELLADRQKLEEQIEAVKQHERQGVIDQIKELMADYEITIEELSKDKRKTKAVHPVAPKYRDPDTGATWSGRGKAPRWLSEKNRDDYLI